MNGIQDHQKSQKSAQNAKAHTGIRKDGLKKCSACSELKSSHEFYKNNSSKDGLYAYCKKCSNKKNKKFELKNKKKRKKYHEQYRQENLEICKKRCNDYKRKNKEKMSESFKKYYNNNIETMREKSKDYHYKNKGELKYKLRCNIRSRIILALKKYDINTKISLKILGCTIDYYINYIESKFTEGMTWEKYGHNGIHIDHIKPCASFDLSKKEEREKCFHFSNTQPLWASENFKKGSNF